MNINKMVIYKYLTHYNILKANYFFFIILCNKKKKLLKQFPRVPSKYNIFLHIYKIYIITYIIESLNNIVNRN